MREHMIAMVGGRGTLRFIIQPALASVVGVIHGLGDQRRGQPPYLIGLARARGRRLAHLGAGLRQILIPLCIAVILSYVFQYVNRGRISFAYGLLYAALFVALPYFVTRALADRIASAAHGPVSPPPRPRAA